MKVLFIFLTGLALNLVTQAQVHAQEATLKAVLINTRELKDLAGKKSLVTDPNKISDYYSKHGQLEKYSLFARFNQNYLNETDPVCAFIGEGCLTVAYLDPSSLIHYHGPQGYYSSLDGRDMSMTEQNMGGQYPDLNGQLELDEFIKLQSALTKTDLTGSLRAKGYDDIFTLRVSEERLVADGFERLKKGAITAQDFTALVLTHPRGFTKLPELHGAALAQFPDADGRPSYVKVLEDVLAKAQLLTVNALWIAADSNIDSYPYTDGTVILRDQLNLRVLFSSLKTSDPKTDRWPQIRGLNLDIRNLMKGQFLQKSKSGNGWRVRGAYNSRNNVIWVDFDQPFFEAVYVLYHELFHVMHHYSSEDAQSLHSLQESLDDPLGVSHDDLGSATKKLTVMLTKNELGGIINQAKLFHSIGSLTELWQGHELPSARAWHDYLYIGAAAAPEDPRSEKSFSPLTPFIRNMSPSGSVTEATPPGQCPTEHLYVTRNDRVNLAQAGRTCSLRPVTVRGDFHPDAAVPEAIYSQFFEIFDKVYFGHIYASSAGSLLTQNIDNLDFDFRYELKDLKMSCQQLSGLYSSFTQLSHWTFGFPFPFTLTDFDLANPVCKSTENLVIRTPGGYIGAEGSHGGLDATPCGDGLPNIDGTDF